MIDLTQLPPPKVIEDIDYEILFARRKAQLITAVPVAQRAAIAAALELESEPLTMLLQNSAYTEMLLRQRVNDAAKSTMLAYAADDDLDNKAADYGVTRLLITPADPDATPPVAAVYELDARLRIRCQMALEGLSVAGSRGAYLFHTLSASGNVLDASITSQPGGIVRVCVLDARGSGVPDNVLLATITTALSAETVRPLSDTVEVVAGQPNAFTIVAQLQFSDGAIASAGGLDAANLRVSAMLAERRKMGGTVPRSAIYAVLQTTGVNRVTLVSPSADIDCNVSQFPHCTAITLSSMP